MVRVCTHHLVGALSSGLVQLLQCVDPALLLCLSLCQDEHLAGQGWAGLLVAGDLHTHTHSHELRWAGGWGDLEDGRDELGASVNHVLCGHSGHHEVLVPVCVCVCAVRRGGRGGGGADLMSNTCVAATAGAWMSLLGSCRNTLKSQTMA